MGNVVYCFKRFTKTDYFNNFIKKINKIGVHFHAIDSVKHAQSRQISLCNKFCVCISVHQTEFLDYVPSNTYFKAANPNYTFPISISSTAIDIRARVFFSSV